MHKALDLCELDILFGTCVYGVAPCVAAVGVTGPIKCFNTRETCQDIEHYAPAPVTLRFATDTGYLPQDIEAIPSLVDVQYSPGSIALGKSLGERDSVTFVFRDHGWADTGNGYDKYRTERPYDAAKLGSYWGKLRARHRSLNGLAIRWITGFVGQSLAEMETRHFVVDSIDGPRKDGTFAIIAKDILKFADGDKSQTPKLSKGVLTADLSAGATSFTISPPGVGADYGAAGRISLGGNEIASFTRAADVFTITRQQLNTPSATHQSLDRVQLVRSYVSQPASAILRDILVNDCGVPASWIPLAEWQAEEAAYLQVLYTRHIAEPTSSRKIIDELIEQAGLAIWTDNRAKKIRFKVLRAIPSDAVTFAPSLNILKGTFSAKDQPETRISQVITRFGLRNPLLQVSEATSFRSVSHLVDVDAELLYASPKIREIAGTWIGDFGNAIADRGNELQLGRYADPPRRFTFQVSRTDPVTPELGMGARLRWPGMFQDATGAEIDTPIQITRVKPGGRAYEVEAEEMRIKELGSGLNNRVIIVPPGSVNFNLRAAHDSVYPPVNSGDAGSVTVTAIVESDITVNSNSVSIPGFDVGDWPFVPEIVIDVRGTVIGEDGAGGKGGNGGSPGNNGGAGVNGGAGGPALKTRVPIKLKVSSGKLWAGRGGGGGGGGGGGAESVNQGGQTSNMSGAGGGGGGSFSTGGARGTGGNNGVAGSSTTGLGGAGGGPVGTGGIAVGGRGGAGGNAGSDYGQAGTSGVAGVGGTANIDVGSGGTFGTGGAGGAAIDGWSFVTVLEGPGDVRGSTIN